MLGVFGDVSRIRELGLEPDMVYVGLDRVNSFAENAVPLLWVPEASGLEEGLSMSMVGGTSLLSATVAV